MLAKVSDRLRKMATLVDPKRRAMVNKLNIEGDQVAPRDSEGDMPEEEGGKPGAPMVPGQTEEPDRPTAAPHQRAPRRKRTQQRKWNPDTRKPLMREYMKDYRGTGKVNERKPQTKGA